MRLSSIAASGVFMMALLATGPAFALPEVGKPAPDFTVTDFDGHDIALKDLKGQVVVVNFWATWCGPCKRELPLLDAYYRIQKKRGLAVVAITTEDSAPLYQLKPLAKALAIPLARRFRGRYGAPEAIPTNYVIDRKGVVRYAKAGAFSLDDLNRILVPLLEEPADEASPAAATATPAASPTR